MKLKSLFNAVISKGIAQDPRGKARVEQELKRLKKDYAELSSSEQKEFDPERLTNPYSDTRILHGSGEEEIRSILVGIDIDVGEVLLAHTLRGQNKKIDLILAHHPEGRALAALHQVMYMQADIACLRGVPVTVADKLLQERIDEVERRLLPVNHTKTADAARLLDIPLMCCHTPADNHVSSFLQRLFEKKGPETVKEIMNIIKEIPEYRLAIKNNAGPKIVSGSDKSRCGKIFVDMTGGTEGSKDIFKKLSQAGTGTIVGMHLSEDHLKQAKAAHMNVVIAGHISSDTIGLNLILDEVEKQQTLDIIACSGFVRIKRK